VRRREREREIGRGGLGEGDWERGIGRGGLGEGDWEGGKRGEAKGEKRERGGISVFPSGSSFRSKVALQTRDTPLNAIATMLDDASEPEKHDAQDHGGNPHVVVREVHQLDEMSRGRNGRDD
jgi:hypothetical protein